MMPQSKAAKPVYSKPLNHLLDFKAGYWLSQHKEHNWLIAAGGNFAVWAGSSASKLNNNQLLLSKTPKGILFGNLDLLPPHRLFDPRKHLGYLRPNCIYGKVVNNSFGYVYKGNKLTVCSFQNSLLLDFTSRPLNTVWKKQPPLPKWVEDYCTWFISTHLEQAKLFQAQETLLFLEQLRDYLEVTVAKELENVVIIGFSNMTAKLASPLKAQNIKEWGLDSQVLARWLANPKALELLYASIGRSDHPELLNTVEMLLKHRESQKLAWLKANRPVLTNSHWPIPNWQEMAWCAINSMGKTND